LSIILDTNVVSELVARDPDPQVIAWIDSVDPSSVYLSVITIGELKKGIEKLPTSKRKRTLGRWLEEDLLVRFEDNVLPLDTNVLLLWGTMIADLEKKGTPMPAIDSLLAATALQANFILVTRNVDHFAPSGINLIDPWVDQVNDIGVGRSD
jgi:tRNA(fMet)-specific endonuclease VapC